MERFALLQDGLVVQVVTVDHGDDIATLFHPSVQTIPCTDGVHVGMSFDGVSFSEQDRAEPSEIELFAYANMKQWAVATGGRTVMIGGVPRTFSTTPESLSLMTGKAFRLSLPAAPATLRWQFGATEFVEIAAADFVQAAAEVADFVQATFDTLADTVVPAIASGEITSCEGVDALLEAI